MCCVRRLVELVCGLVALAPSGLRRAEARGVRWHRRRTRAKWRAWGAANARPGRRGNTSRDSAHAGGFRGASPLAGVGSSEPRARPGGGASMGRRYRHKTTVQGERGARGAAPQRAARHSVNKQWRRAAPPARGKRGQLEARVSK
ncbi:MAG: hypothetical protein J3K34DRAFT_437129 [Monoraphidium minutum]|nr:MAG: hypothetical protein J3K34DRAFT_437129 [Monoraphidium minutum]